MIIFEKSLEKFVYSRKAPYLCWRIVQRMTRDDDEDEDENDNPVLSVMLYDCNGAEDGLRGARQKEPEGDR